MGLNSVCASTGTDIFLCSHTQQEGINSLQCFWCTTDNWDLGFGCTWLVLAEKKKKTTTKKKLDNTTWTRFVILYWSQWRGTEVRKNSPPCQSWICAAALMLNSQLDVSCIGCHCEKLSLLPLSGANLQAYVRMHIHTESLHKNIHKYMNTHTLQCSTQSNQWQQQQL